MIRVLPRRFYPALLTLCVLLFSADSFAQLQLLSSSTGKGRKERSDEPTIINSDAMDIDMANDKVTLLGNVDVQDPEMNIKCRKMTISTRSGCFTGDSTPRNQRTGRRHT